MSSIALAGLLQTLQRIESETGVVAKPLQNAQKSTFEAQREKVSVQLKVLRAMISERDELLSKSVATTKNDVRASCAARQRLLIVTADIDELERLHVADKKDKCAKCKEAKKATNTMCAQCTERHALEQELVDLAKAHLAECERLERRVYFGDDYDVEMGTMSGVASSLPSIDDDTALGVRFKLLLQQDAALDVGLDKLLVNVVKTKQIAIDMRDGVAVQVAVLEELDSKVEKNTDGVRGLNRRLKRVMIDTNAG